jgi:hypothetical protein
MIFERCIPTRCDFSQGTMNVTRSIAYGIVGRCKTVASQKPVPVHSILAEELTQWRYRCRYRELDDWVFANKHHRGRHPIGDKQFSAELSDLLRRESGSRKWIGPVAAPILEYESSCRVSSPHPINTPKQP